MRPSNTQKTFEPQAPGAFLPDGTWNPKGQLHHRGELDRLVRVLCRERKFARLSPHEASIAIQASSQALAFPNWRQWETCDHWALAWTSTSAEEVVKRAGETCATEHHWCGAGKWLPGKESNCTDLAHRGKLEHERVRELVATIAWNGPGAPLEGSSGVGVAAGS